MTIGADSAGLGGGPGATGDRAALRALFDRLRAHVAEAEDRAETALDQLSATLAAPLAAPRTDPADLRARAEDLFSEHRGAAREVTRLADEVGAMADGLDARLARGDRSRAESLRTIDRELRDAAARLDARLARAEAEVEEALAGLAEQLARWEAAAAGEDERLSAALVAQLDAAEVRWSEEVARLTAATPLARAPARSEPARRPSPSRSAALLLSAGVACLGLATLAVVLEPPPAPTKAAAQAEPEIVLRGPILIAPPRFAAADELAPTRQPGAPADGGRALAAAMADAEAGRPGAVARLRALGEAGQPRAQMYLAKLYETGRGVPADSAEARRWTARAADAGDPVAMHNLALYYLQGRGGPRDDAMAARLLRRAANGGVVDSQFNLGLLYETGAGVDRNLVEAYRWFQTAAHGGDLNARARAVALEERLSAKELASVDRLVGGFRPGADAAEETVLVAGAATVAESQKKLARLGFYIGPTDGQDTPAYRRAVEAYRKSRQAQPATVAAVGQP